MPIVGGPRLHDVRSAASLDVAVSLSASRSDASLATVLDVPIVPDTKDWTWVIEQGCPACGFDASAVERSELAGLVRQNAREWVEVLEAPGASPPAPGR